VCLFCLFGMKGLVVMGIWIEVVWKARKVEVKEEDLYSKKGGNKSSETSMI